MNSISNLSLVRQKATVETVFQMDVPVNLYGPREDQNGSMYVCSQVGEILKFTETGEWEIFLTIGGQPLCKSTHN